MPERAQFPSARTGSSASIVAVAAIILFSGCGVGQDAAPSASASAPANTQAEADVSPAPTTTPKPPPTFKPDLGARENQDYFDWISAGVLAVDRKSGGRAFIDALTEGGFDKTQMEVTFDRTAVDLEADSIQFSVRVNGECLIGQTGPASGGYRSIVTAPLARGTCLVGSTRQIDW